MALWFPSAGEFLRDLAPKPPTQAYVQALWPAEWDGTSYVDVASTARRYADANAVFEGLPLHYCTNAQLDRWSALGWSEWMAQHWMLPLCACGVYLVAILGLQRRTARVDVRRFALWWNVSLAAFSVAGFALCAPVLLHELRSNGLYFTVCAPSIWCACLLKIHLLRFDGAGDWYGLGYHGLFVLLFIFSKFAELVDTALLLLAGRRVLALHWWHHVSVLLYCWHSYSAQVSTGIWFASMNYGVHSIMYAYFAATQYSRAFRAAARDFAVYITLLQLAQMLVGIWVTACAVFYQKAGRPCGVNRVNSILGLSMYTSYFLLFLQFFVASYLVKKPSDAGNRRKEQ